MQSNSSMEQGNLAMHIAVCDNNVGDRKQLERLLKRESDARAGKTGVFYVDSYGNAKAVMLSPMLYDAFFIDMADGETDGCKITDLLLDVGVTAPIILCISSIDYRERLRAATHRNYHNIYYLDKPLKKAELAEMLDMCIEKKSRRVSTIELRGENDTRYVTEDDIVYAKSSGNYVYVYLKDGSILKILSSLENFYSQLLSFNHYAAVTYKSMINVTYVEKTGLFKVTLSDGHVLRTSPSYAADIKRALRQYAEELQNPD